MLLSVQQPQPCKARKSMITQQVKQLHSHRRYGVGVLQWPCLDWPGLESMQLWQFRLFHSPHQKLCLLEASDILAQQLQALGLQCAAFVYDYVLPAVIMSGLRHMRDINAAMEVCCTCTTMAAAELPHMLQAASNGSS